MLKPRVAVRKKTGGDSPHMLVQGGKHGGEATKHMGTKYPGGPKKSTQLTRKYVYKKRRKKGEK